VLVQEKDDIFVLTSCQQQLMEFHPRSCNRDILTHMRSSRAAFLPRYMFSPVLRIRIRIHFGRLDPDPNWEFESGSRRAKMNHKSEESSSFEVLDVLF
jgi:hypothetical protein